MTALSSCVVDPLRLPVQLSLLVLFRSWTWAFLSARRLLALFLKPLPPSAILAAPSEKTINALVQRLEAEFPRVALPERMLNQADGGQPHVLAFAPCSNLCVYMFGVAACLQRATNYKVARDNLRFQGSSSGALVALALAVDADIPSVFERCFSMLTTLNLRLGGWIGAYSATIRAVGQHMCDAAATKPAHEGASKHLQIGVTALLPLPVRRELRVFSSTDALCDALLASCYIPVVWEETPWLPGIGLCLDGGASNFLEDGDLVVGPWHSGSPDIGPVEEFPRQLVFKPIDAGDMLRLFEEGWRDAARWAASGGPSSREARLQKLQGPAPGLRALISEGISVLRQVLGLTKSKGGEGGRAAR